MLEFNHDHCPDDERKAAEFALKLMQFLRSGDPKLLPSGVTFFATRHHSDPCPLGKPPRGWQNNL
jgi:hypothetical protein